MESTITPVVAAAAGKILKPSKRSGRGVPQINEIYTKKCSCSRDKTMVFCRACGYYCNGRIRLKCQQHPRVSYDLLKSQEKEKSEIHPPFSSVKKSNYCLLLVC